MPRKRRLNQRKRALIAASAYVVHSRGSAKRKKKNSAAFSGWSMKAKLGFWGLVDGLAGK